MRRDVQQFWTLQSKLGEALDDDPDWNEQRGPWIGRCKGCGSILPGVYPKPFEAVVQNRQRASISLAQVPVLRRKLFEFLHPYAPGMIPGEVRFGDGRVQRDSVTVHCPASMSILMRGGHGSREWRAYRVCASCGRNVTTYALFKKPWYVMRRDIPAGEVFVADRYPFLVTTKLREQIEYKMFPDLVHKPVLVMDEPIEPIPEFGDAVSSSEDEGASADAE